MPAQDRPAEGATQHTESARRAFTALEHDVGTPNDQRIQVAAAASSLLVYGIQAARSAWHLDARAFWQSDLSLSHGASAVSVMEEHRFLWLWCNHPTCRATPCRSATASTVSAGGRAVPESPSLLIAAYREPELDEVNAVADQHPLELWHLPHKLRVLCRGAKPMTRSTPARLYQDRSNITISPAVGRWLT